METSVRDKQVLEKILGNILELYEMVEGVKSFEDYEKDRKTKHACAMVLLNIGELARKLSDMFRDKYTEIPVSKMIALRNAVAHEYVKLKDRTVWDTIKIAIPELEKQIKEIITKII